MNDREVKSAPRAEITVTNRQGGANGRFEDFGPARGGSDLRAKPIIPIKAESQSGRRPTWKVRDDDDRDEIQLID
jgi:hypothetical protein